jgi:hypothetical protein
MSVPTLAQIQTLYKSTLTAASRFASYNYRTHFTRRADEVFKPLLARLDGAEKSGSSSSSSSGGKVSEGELQAFWEDHSKELEVLKRAAEVNRMFEGPKLVVEHPRVITGGGGAGAEASMAGTEKLEQGGS